MFTVKKASILAFIVAVTVSSHAHAATLTVNATDNIYGAGQASAPDSGNVPSSVAVNSGSVVTVSATGSVVLNLTSGNTPNDADGIGAATSFSTNSGFGSLSGIRAPNAGYLVGVFTPIGGPSGNAPTSLDFSSGTSFASISPVLDQVFFIGDGLTGDGTGSVQSFIAPTGAGKLFLGISDACGYNGSPSCYGDNTGSFAVSVSAVPLPASLPMLGTAVAGLVGLGVRKSRRATTA